MEALEEKDGSFMEQDTTKKEEETLENLLRKNIALNEQVLKFTKETRRMLFFLQLGGVLKLVLILIPLILGVIYLSPFLQQYSSAIKDSLDFIQENGALLRTFEQD